MTNPRATLFSILPLSLLCLILLFLFSSWVFPFTTDSMFYTSTAENISHFKGLLFSNFFVQPPAPNFLPTVFEPPGYPILIAKLKFLGMDTYTASLLWPRLFFLILPFLFFIIFKRLMPQTVAWVATLVCTFMFSILKCSLMAWADIPYLCCSLISLWMVFVIIEKKGTSNIWFILLGGLMAGFSFLLRYVGVTLVISISLGFLMALSLRMISIKDFIKTACIYALGLIAIVAPYLMRNWVVFGKLQPSHLPPSNISFLDNCHAYGQSLADMIFASNHFEMVLWILLLGLGIAVMIHIKNSLNLTKIYTYILLTYFCLNSFLLLGFKTFYLAPEAINERYLIQIAWILMGSLVYAIYIGLKKIQVKTPLDIKSITAIFLLAFFLIQSFSIVDFYFGQQKIKNFAQKVRHYIPLLQNLPEDFVVVSNVAEITYYFAKRNVRMLANYTPYGLVKVLGEERRFVVLIIKEDQYLSPAWEYPSVWKNPQGYGKIYADHNAELLIPL